MRYSILYICLVAGVGCFCLDLAGQPALYYHAGTTRKVSQLTGDWDQPFGIPIKSLTATRSGLFGTDLGSSFEHGGDLVFLFGDSWGREGNHDTYGISASTDPWQLEMSVPTAPDGRWRTITPPGLSYAEFCVPSHGISIDGVIYVVYTQNGTGGGIMKRSFLISSADDGATWQTLFQLDNNTEANPRFINVWLAEQDGYVYIFGSGAYRASSPTLARVPREQIAQKSAWEYYAGMMDGSLVWRPRAIYAVNLFTHNEVGEFSCAWIESLNCWVMLYNSGNPRGITMRTASEPWGPWSTGQVIMNPNAHVDQAYGFYMHVAWDFEKRDLFSDPLREFVWGGEYGPYLIPRFAKATAEGTELFYTMSTWNPYQVVLMRSVVSTSQIPTPPPTVAQRLDHSGWMRYPQDVAIEFMRSGRPHISTFTAAGDANTGWLWRPMPAGTARVSFTVHGGHAEVFLLEGGADLPASGDVQTVSRQLREGTYGRVAARVTGVDDNSRDIIWDLDVLKFDSPLKIVVLDEVVDGWGFVSLSDLELQVLMTAGLESWLEYE